MKPFTIGFFDSLEFKFLRVTTPVVLATAVVLFAIVSSLSAKHQLDELRDRRENLVSGYSLLAADWVWNLDRQRVLLSLERLAEEDFVIGAEVTDEDGERIAAVQLPGTSDDLITLREAIRFRTDSSETVIGYVTVLTTNAPVMENILENLVSDGLLFALITGAGIASAAFANRKAVVQPLARMMAAIEKMEGVSLPDPIDWRSRDEIGAVIDAFNLSMARRNKAETDRMKIAGELQEAQKLEAVGQLAAGIAHEINTPAQFISGNLKFLEEAHQDLSGLIDMGMDLAQVAKGREVLSEKARRLLEFKEEIDLDFLRKDIPSAILQSQEGIRHVAKIVSAMKDFAHPGNEDMKKADLNEALRNTITLSSNEWKHVAEIHTELDELLPMIDCYAGELKQVFLNMIVNAAHAIGDTASNGVTGTIRIATTVEGDSAVIRIADDGAGIPEEIHDQIFNPFFTTKDVGRGTGQGLSIAYDIVVGRHGGSLTFESEEGCGTEFTIRLPMTAAAGIGGGEGGTDVNPGTTSMQMV